MAKKKRTPQLLESGTRVYYYENDEAIDALVLHAHTEDSIDLVTVQAEVVMTPTGPPQGLQGRYYIRREFPRGPNGWGLTKTIPTPKGRKPRVQAWPK